MGGEEAVQAECVPFLYSLYDIAAEYWHEPNPEETWNNLSRETQTRWLAYREQRSAIEQARAERSKNENE